MKQLFLLALIAGALLFSTQSHCETTDDNRVNATVQSDETLGEVIAMQRVVINEYKTVNAQLQRKLHECNGVYSVALPNGYGNEIASQSLAMTDKKDWRTVSDFYLTQYKPEQVDRANEIIDSLQKVADQLSKAVPEKGSGSTPWYGFVILAVSLITNFVQFVTGKKKK